jgi:hypothetical protein
MELLGLLGTIGVGISFTGLGLVMRRQNQKNWKAFLFGGIAILTLVIISRVFGLSI